MTKAVKCSALRKQLNSATKVYFCMNSLRRTSLRTVTQFVPPCESSIYILMLFHLWKSLELEISRRRLLWAPRPWQVSARERWSVWAVRDFFFSFVLLVPLQHQGLYVYIRRLNVKNRCSNFVMLVRHGKCCANCSSHCILKYVCTNSFLDILKANAVFRLLS